MTFYDNLQWGGWWFVYYLIMWTIIYAFIVIGYWAMTGDWVDGP